MSLVPRCMVQLLFWFGHLKHQVQHALDKEAGFLYWHLSRKLSWHHSTHLQAEQGAASNRCL